MPNSQQKRGEDRGDPLSPDEAKAKTGTHTSDQDSALEAWLQAVLKLPIPDRHALVSPSPIIRRWPPRGNSFNAKALSSEEPIAVTGLFKSRHPALLIEALEKCPLARIGRSPRSRIRGRQHKFPSHKMGRLLRASADLEKELMEICEADPLVLAFVEQPVRIRYQDDTGKLRNHTPDVAITYVDSNWFVEVKWEADACRAENESRWPCIGRALSSAGYGYEVLTEHHLRAEPRFGNIKKLIRARHVSPPDVMAVSKIRQTLETSQNDQMAHRTIEEILDRVPCVTLHQLYLLILRGVLRIDLNEKLAPFSRVSLGTLAALPLVKGDIS